VVTRIIACVIALPILTTLLDFAGLAGGIISEMFVPSGMSVTLYINDALGPMG
jgi:phospholipid/cholesterol/gamma-HCH transport system permease protein